MRSPPLLLGAALLFWGWQSGVLFLAAGMALILEGSRLIRFRLNPSPSDFSRIADLCGIGLLVLFIYFYASKGSTRAILGLLQWLPLVCFPLLAAQVYSTLEKMDMAALFWTLRRKRKEKPLEQRRSIDITFPYLALSILSASAANVRTPWFYAGVFSLAAWALWHVRSRGFSPVFWITLSVFAGIAGYAGHVGLHHLQGALESKATEWFTEFMRKDPDPYRVTTAIGDVGSLKLSDRILFRVVPQPGLNSPLLLREACYNLYRSSSWFALHSEFRKVEPEPDGTTWKISAAADSAKTLRVSEYLRQGKGVLKLPGGAFEIAELPVLKMVKNPFGAVKVQEGPGLITYQIRFNPHISSDSPPGETDLVISESERAFISPIAWDLQITSMPPQEVLKKIYSFFQVKFKYSLVLNSPGQTANPLESFLVTSREGHCEYFATATVLLLRSVGIPARYATGYSVQERSGMENGFIVRTRHAHAWALVHIEGAWRDFDTTPSSWFSAEEKSSSPLKPVYDLWSFLTFKFSRWHWNEGREGASMKYLVWFLIPLILLLARRFFAGSLVRNPGRVKKEILKVESRAGADSEFYLIEKRLLQWGYERYPWETMATWIERIKMDAMHIEPLLRIHYRYRFDPKGITATEKEILKTGVQTLLEDISHPLERPGENSAGTGSLVGKP